MSAADFFEAVGEKRSPGLAGQIEALLEERPWLTSTEIAKELGKKPDRIASIVPALVREGRLLRENDLSARGGSLFARSSPRLVEKNAAVLTERRAAKREHEAAKANKEAAAIGKALAKKNRTVTLPDWRPAESVPEDYYA